MERQKQIISPVSKDHRCDSLRVALLCPGVGLVQRGFERFFRDLYDTLSDECEVILFKGGGPKSKTEKIPFFLPRNGVFLRYIPLHWLIFRTRMHVECLTFALFALPALVRGNYDVVHVIDPPLARILYHLRKRLGLKFRLLYTEGTAMPPGDYPPCDFIHQMSPVTADDARAYGHDPSRMAVLPSGLNTRKFHKIESNSRLRKRYEVSDQTFVVLSVAALNRYHKRTHYLIDELAELDGDVLLWLDGSMDHGDTDLPDYARQRLGDKVRITRVDSSTVGDLYQICDVMVLASLHEAYGLVVAEALASGASVLTHDNPHFKWLVGSEDNLLDLSQSGNLAAKLLELRDAPEKLRSLRRAEAVQQRLGWEHLRSAYLNLYAEVAEIPLSG